MLSIIGKTLVFTDQHFGVKSNSPSRQKICIEVIDKILDEVQKSSIDNIIFCGDFFHQRNALTVDTLNLAYDSLKRLSEKCAVYMVLGNHDLFNKNSVDVNSINIFRGNKSIHVISQAEEFMLNTSKCLFVPWLGDLSGFKKNSYDFLFGHFDVSTKFIISSYAKQHMAKAKAKSVEDDEFLDGIDEIDGKDAQLDFMDLLKKTGIAFAGHIHQHKEMIVKGRKFIFIGSPYQQNLGDIGCSCGYYLIDVDSAFQFKEIEGLPKHVKIKCSEVKKTGIDQFDFSNVAGNIIQKVYDVDMTLDEDLKLNQKISSYKPYEELLPEYEVQLNFNSVTDKEEQNIAQMLKTDKLTYIQKYIAQLDGSALKDKSIEKPKLLAVLKKYYNDVVKG